ncbi:hypothetical protein RIF29_29899 [Crotalaria pallida]|uniref:Glycosyltransferase n=1 Tax=Crotalaria pallida TaxID=3830 RepID=A0AAN9HWL8_CROPI
MAKTTHIAVIPSPGFSHLVPITEFSKRLVQQHPNFHLTFIIPSLGPPPNNSKAYLETLPSNIDSIFLPAINKEDLPKAEYPGILIQLTITHSLPSIQKVLKSLTSKAPLSALVADVFAFQTLAFAKELNSLSFIYFPGSAMALSLFLYMPKLDQEVSGEYKDLTKPIQIPGCVPLLGQDLPAPAQDRSSDAYKSFLERSKGLSTADGVLINTFSEMESGTIRALEEDENCNINFYPVGPITQKGSTIKENGSECLRWLDNQPPNSVLYVSFGSGGTLSQDQVNELALGLELSGQKFLWVSRAPSNSVSAAYLDTENDDPLQFLPSGFLDRTKEQGLVVPSWAPQVQVLSHSSVGGFLSHCGWNSILESMQEGVPLITWPLFAEQRMNAVMLTDGLKVALRPKVNEDGIVEKKEIAKVIKSLMEGVEGKGIRIRMKDLKDSAANALKEDGSSTQTMSKLASKWENFGGI